MWHVEFSSAEFLPYLPEDCQANPGVYGFELAHWLSMALARHGVVTSYPMGEDWGWFIEYVEGEHEIMVGCASVCGQGEGYAGKSVTWGVFVKPHSSLKKMLRGASPDAAVKRLAEAIAAVLADQGIEARQVAA